ncbi:flavo protein NADH-dependent oxidoreductase [Coprinellus micaceus]|uniref:Flavo protein NADH-dependent oxidoreductase n=1 Tax=Coprinellus micaceus TaxID=71717 RepID=A0A4Y7RUH0_COPMI|nr:flavo protein NADH-dependent oxidoreductase [Coprinellus micaceus]
MPAVAATQALFTPLKVGDITVPNRTQIAAMTRNRSIKTVPSDLMAEYYAQRARGGAGLIVTEGILITRQGTEWEAAPGIWNAEQVAGWKKVTDAIHANGSFVYAQLWHLGRVSHPDAPQQKLAGVPVYAPSAISARGGKFRFLPSHPGYVTPTALEDPTFIIEQFKQAAINAKEAGFDGVELHGANGYLISQFLDSNSNLRTDKWGGSVENRARFPLEVLKALVSVFGNNVAIKLSPAGGYNDMGMPLEETLETFRYLLTETSKLPLAYVTLMRYSPYLDAEYDGKKRAIVHDILESYRSYITNPNTKVYLNAGLQGDEAAKLIEEGKIDGGAFATTALLHPDFAKRFKYGKPLTNVPNYPLMQIGAGEDPEKWDVGFTDYPEAEYDASEI